MCQFKLLKIWTVQNQYDRVERMSNHIKTFPHTNIMLWLQNNPTIARPSFIFWSNFFTQCSYADFAWKRSQNFVTDLEFQSLVHHFHFLAIQRRVKIVIFHVKIQKRKKWMHIFSSFAYALNQIEDSEIDSNMYSSTVCGVVFFILIIITQNEFVFVSYKYIFYMSNQANQSWRSQQTLNCNL